MKPIGNYLHFLATVLTLGLALVCSAPAFGQLLSLQQCLNKAVANHPLGLQKTDMEQIDRLKREMIATAYLPKVQLQAQASYRSDVPHIELNNPMLNFDLPAASKDQYSVAIDVNQLIYDGGISQKRKQLQERSYITEKIKLEVELYQLKAQVNTAFFGMLMLDEQLELLKTSEKVLTERLGAVQSGVTNGVLLSSDQWLLEAELIRLDQQLEEVELSMVAGRQVLQLLIGEDIGMATLTQPAELSPTGNAETAKRPEHELFSAQQQQLQAARNLTASQNHPMLIGFGQAGYGKPGLNMLSNAFDFYYIVGLKLSWKLWDGQALKKEQQVYQHQAKLVDSKRQAFNRTIQLERTKVLANIDKLKHARVQDNKLIKLQEDILHSMAAQLDNGVITSSEYIHQLNAVTQAKIGLKTHELQLVQAGFDYKTIMGHW